MFSKKKKKRPSEASHSTRLPQFKFTYNWLEQTGSEPCDDPHTHTLCAIFTYKIIGAYNPNNAFSKTYTWVVQLEWLIESSCG